MLLKELVNCFRIGRVLKVSLMIIPFSFYVFRLSIRDIRILKNV